MSELTALEQAVYEFARCDSELRHYITDRDEARKRLASCEADVEEWRAKVVAARAQLLAVVRETK